MKLGIIFRHRYSDGKEVFKYVDEPFITTDELKCKCERWCEYANNCNNKKYEHPLVRGIGNV